MSKCAECGKKEATIPVQWESIEQTEMYCQQCEVSA
jgi:hypothetical protein